MKMDLALTELISNADRFSLESLGKTFLNWTSVSSTIEIKSRKEEFFFFFSPKSPVFSRFGDSRENGA